MKMAIVGCEASGKTVFMCALTDYYGREAVKFPNRVRIVPENAAANSFENYQFRQMRRLRQWPPATSPDHTLNLNWSMRYEGRQLAEIDMLEFGGETYRAAFREGNEGAIATDDSVRSLMNYLAETDYLVVLVSIKALLTDDKGQTEEDFNRHTEAQWVTHKILKYFRTHRPKAGIVIGLTQADKYRNDLLDAGSARALLAQYWPTVSAAAENIPVVDVASVSKTDEDGNPVEGYNTNGILPVMREFSRHCFGDPDALENAKKISRFHRIKTLWTTCIECIKLNPKLFIWGGVALAALAIIAGTWIMRGSSSATQEVEVVQPAVEQPTPAPQPVVVVAPKAVEEPTVKLVVSKPVEEAPTVVTPATPTNDVVQPQPEVKVEEPKAPIEPQVEPQVVPQPIPQQADGLQQIPPGYRIWTDYDGRKIIAKWIGVAVDESGITILSRYGRRIDAVLWKFSDEDKAYIQEEITRHTARGEKMVDGEWVKSVSDRDNPLLVN